MIFFKNVNVTIGDKIILKNLSFNLEKNNILAIIGESGGGKTTIANILMKKIFEYDGEVYLDDKEIRNYSNIEYYKKISIVLQDYTTALNPCMTIRDVLYEPCEIKKEKVDYIKIKDVIYNRNENKIFFNKWNNFIILDLEGKILQQIYFNNITRPDLFLNLMKYFFAEKEDL